MSLLDLGVGRGMPSPEAEADLETPGAPMPYEDIKTPFQWLMFLQEHMEWHGWDADDDVCRIVLTRYGWAVMHRDFELDSPHSPFFRLRGRRYFLAEKAMKAADAEYGRHCHDYAVANGRHPSS